MCQPVWRPIWLIATKTQGLVGLTLQNEAYVVLVPTTGEGWKPTRHTPPEVTEFLAMLVTERHYIEDSLAG